MPRETNCELCQFYNECDFCDDRKPCKWELHQEQLFSDEMDFRYEIKKEGD